jgi:hypothetical protein
MKGFLGPAGKGYGHIHRRGRRGHGEGRIANAIVGGALRSRSEGKDKNKG